MAENENHHTRFNSTRKPHSQTTSLLRIPRKSLSSPTSPINKRNLNENRSSRSRQLWNIAIDSVLEHEKCIETSTPATSSTTNNAPIGWYNLTKR
ncbi:unnamed protein product [Rotaria sp. Silwood2]|nr:unnamed protein product [Rotaria sp. Silwood2]CAF2535703.1 unnamed protein product [Rotaria sp. Silwood2]CAF2787925.1 unnamed protein product [Rotaria sp. Silwood2]CAF2933269.1 unnamed protein product [Rotaria sp. Silwood2]CAF4025626.1 unnamed protein product [Rotaria sp. Silwood2]